MPKDKHVSELVSSRDSTGKRTLYSFDAEGNEVTKAEVTSSETKTTTYAYSPAGKLDRVELPNGKSIDYSYDGLGNRVDRTLSLPDGTTKATSYLNDISGPLTQVLSSTMTGGKSQTYAYGLQRISSTLTGPPDILPAPKTDYFLYDGLGSVVGQTSEQANLTHHSAPTPTTSGASLRPTPTSRTRETPTPMASPVRTGTPTLNSSTSEPGTMSQPRGGLGNRIPCCAFGRQAETTPMLRTTPRA